ncbi:MAG: hypothetical protein QOE64_962, partial [Frankiales bacterium]|nr:hypothetical protein [Frankiales bacterium]
TGVPAPTDTETDAPTPSATPAAAKSKGSGFVGPLRAVQAAIVLAVLLGLAGGVGLYVTREHR